MGEISGRSWSTLSAIVRPQQLSAKKIYPCDDEKRTRIEESIIRHDMNQEAEDVTRLAIMDGRIKRNMSYQVS